MKSFLLSLLFLAGGSAFAAERPNVLLILVDDLKPALGCYGDPVAKTPQIDALAARGMRFDLAYCNQAVCAPSRFTLMLGSHSTSTGLYGLGSPLRKALPDAVTLPQHFAQHGYRTESLGKVFHIGHGNQGDPDSFSVPHFHDKVIEYADPASTHGGQLTREEAYFTNQKLDQIRSLPRGAAFESPDVDDAAYADGRVADETIKRLRAAKIRREDNNIPFFITAGFARPHLPFSAPKKYWNLYDSEKLPLPEFEELPAHSPRAAHKRGGEICNYFPVPDHGDYRAGKEISPGLKRDLIHGYYASTSYVDAQIGKVIDELDRLELADETIVVLWGDHGFHLGDLGIWTKHTNYEQANRIPILLAGPGIKPATSTKQPAESVDLYPTLAELAGLPAPKGPQRIDGRSLVPVLKDPSARVRDHAYHAYPKRKLGRAIRTERYRLVEWKGFTPSPDTAEYELYDYQTDPLETENLAAKRPEVVAQLQEMLKRHPTPVQRNAGSLKPAPVLPAPVVATPTIANRPFHIVVEVTSPNPRGVVLAHGGIENGYALHFVDGKPAFDVRIAGTVTRLVGEKPARRSIRLEASLTRDQIRLSVNGGPAITAPSPGLIPVQPKDGLSVGLDTHSSAGDYTAPNPFAGTVLSTRVDAGGKPPAVAEVLGRRDIEAGLASHDRALFVKPASWRYTFERPAEGWEKPGFNDRNWKRGVGGFGTHTTPGLRVGTEWNTKEIWLRRTFEFDKAPAHPTLLVYHDEDAKIYLNGTRVVSLKGFVMEYKTVRLAGAPVKAGTNLVAVHCRQTVGGQGIDVHLGSADEMARLKRAPKPIPKVTMRTPWGEKITAANAWTEYPRPALRRKNWTNLNGQWDYAVTPKKAKPHKQWDGKILVPFAIEAPLSGVEKRFTPDDALWYRRSLTLLKKNPHRRYKLHFEAVDYQSTVWVNGRKVGSHTGGNLPFSFDVTEVLQEGKNEITLSVTDATDSAYQLHGKQRLTPKGIWYTPVSGIWQTVWMEEVPETHITGLKITPKMDGSVRIQTAFSGPATSTPVKVTASRNGEVVAKADGTTTDLLLRIPNPERWSPDSPVLYDLKVAFGDDVVASYVGIRETGRVRDADGHWRFTLNGKPIFHWGTLDQGWWPDGLLTPPSDVAMVSDIEYLKAAGFNTIRKHIKIEPRRYYYHCDRLGMLVWQDQVSARRADDPEWIRKLQPVPPAAPWPVEAHAQFMAELKEMIDGLYSHPCIVQWVPFNERWGQHQTMEVAEWTVQYDPTREINIASGGNFFPVGHIADEHHYPHPEFPFDPGQGGRFDTFVKVMGEFGGHGFPVEGHLWSKTTRNWGYGGLPKDKNEWLERYRTSIEMLADLKKKGVAAGIYTQTTDVEGEINGLITYDRKVQKVRPEQLADIHRKAGLID